MRSSLPVVESVSDTPGPLHNPIESSEVTKSIRSLPNDKAAGTDVILNEMLQSMEILLNKPLCHLFNNILRHGAYPKSWRESIFVPIPKGGAI